MRKRTRTPASILSLTAVALLVMTTLAVGVFQPAGFRTSKPPRTVAKASSPARAANQMTRAENSGVAGVNPFVEPLDQLDAPGKPTADSRTAGTSQEDSPKYPAPYVIEDQAAGDKTIVRTATIIRSAAEQEQEQDRDSRERDRDARRQNQPQQDRDVDLKRREARLVRAHDFKGDLRNLPYRRPARRPERPEREAPDLNPSLIVPPGGVAPGNQSPDETSRGPISPQPNPPSPPPNIVFEGLDREFWGSGSPPDTNGDVGPQYYIQSVNSSVGIYDKAGNQQAAFTFDTLMSQGAFGNQCDTENFGDPVVLYDTFEDRWILTDFAFTLDGGGNVNPPIAFQCFAVSKTGNPLTGGWNFYSITVTDGLNDYPKFGIWSDGLYMSSNVFGYAAGGSFITARAWAFNKQQMYAGAPTVQVVAFNVPGGDFTVVPSNARLQTGTPPPGRPNLFVSSWQFLNALTVYKFHVDWSNISLSTFTGPDQPVAATAWPNAAVANAPQPGTANLLDVLQIRAMVQSQYTNFGGTESVWVPHTVRRANTSGFAAPRWYQVNVSGGTVAANLPQAVTWDPDGANVNHRYMPSLALNRSGDMAMGYSISNSTTRFPSMAYAGRLAGDPINTFSQTETFMFTGTASQTTSTRWGDYSSMTLDPDGCTFWYTNEYANPADQTAAKRWKTKIGSFTFPGCTTFGAGGTVTGTVTVNPGGAPISGATVNLGSRSTTTNGSGVYSFLNIPAGTYPSIDASAPGYDSASATSIVVTDGGTTTQDFALTDAPDSACLTDTTQADFQTGVPTNLDLTTSPGDVTLTNAPTVDQSNTAGTTTGTGFGTPNWTGQTFIPGVTGQLAKADIQLFCQACGATPPNLTLSVRNTSAGLPTGADLSSVTIPGSAFASGGTVLFTATFGAPATLTSGTQYALILRPVSVPAGSGYFWIRSSPSTYASGSRVLSADSGGTWSGDTTRDYNFATYMQTGYPASGNLVSATKDANPAPGFTPIWSTLSWNATTPANTSLSFQVAGSNDVNGPFNFVGPDGTAGTFFTTSPANLQPQFYNLRYLKYKAYFATTDSAQTPTLNDVTLCFNDVDCSSVVATITPTPAEVCESSTGNTASGPAGMTSYAWGIINGTITSATNTQSITYTAGSSGTVTLDLTVTAPNGCISSGSQPVTINPIPATPAASNGGPYCEGATIQLSTAAVGGATYAWTGPNGFTSSLQNPTRINATTADAGTYSVTVTVSGCTSAAGTTDVVVNPIPTTPTATNTGPYCESQTIQLNTPTVAGATYSWTGPNGFTSSLQNPTRTNATSADSGTYSVTVTVNGCTSAAGTTDVSVTLPPAPTITPGGPTTFCTGGSVTLSSSSATGNQWYLNNNPIGGAINQDYVATASGDYTVVVTDVNSCASAPSAPTTVTVLLTAATVINTNDSGAGSLRQAIADLCDGGTIDFNIPGGGPDTITLTTGELLIDKSMTINGPTTKSLTISGNNNSRIFNVGPAVNFTFSYLTLTGGSAPAGGAVNSLGNLTILNSTFTGNTAAIEGGAIDTEGGIVKIINSTISGNTSSSGVGSGLLNCGNSQTTLTNVTITNNATEGIRHLSSIPLVLNNTIVAGNPTCGACDQIDIFVDTTGDPSTTIDPASANNIVGVDTGVVGLVNGTNGNQIGSSEAPVNPLLGALANNGGPTSTHALNDFSPALDAGSNALAVDQANAALTTDQRGAGFPRIENAVVDIGAYEKTFVPPPPAADLGVTKTASGEQSLANRDVVYTIMVTNAGPDAASNASLSDALPGDMTFVSLSAAAGWTCLTPSVGTNGAISCSNPSLGVGVISVFTLTGHIPASAPGGTAYHNVAAVSSALFDPDSVNDQASANTTVVTCITNPVVVSNADSGPGTLRQAITDACDNSIITFDMTQVASPITLTSGELAINKNLTIQGPGANLLTISGNTTTRIFNLPGGTINAISGLTLADARISSVGTNHGGAIFNNATLVITDTALTGNSVSGASSNRGGAIFNTGTLSISGSTLSGNSAVSAGIGTQYGGAIANTGTLTLTNSTISGNSATGGAGGDNRGGGIYSGSGSMTILNCTLSANTVSAGATSQGGGIDLETGGTANLRNTIAAGNTAATGPDLAGTYTSQGNNLIGNGTGASGFTNGVNGDQVGTSGSPINPLLAALGNYGGPTQTRALLPGSPAINTGNNCVTDVAHCSDSNIAQITQDQRGFARQVDSNVDIGAFESRGFNLTLTSGTPQSTPILSAFGSPLVITVSSGFGEPVQGGLATFTAPVSGASATFTGGVTTLAASLDASGQASVPATANGTAGGPYDVTATSNGVSGSANFTLTNLKANQTISFAAIPAKTFGDADFVVSPTATSGFAVSLAASGNCTVTSPSPGTVHITGAGSCTITASQAGDANYNAAANVPQSFTIAKANQTITFGALSNKTFGDADFNVSPTASSGLAVSLAASGNCTVTTPSPGTVHITGAGSCTITASQAGSLDFNAAANVPQSFTIAKANQTITFGALANKTFGDADFNASPTASSGLAVSLAASGNCTVTTPSPGTVHITGAGSCTITASQPGDANYNAATNVPQSFSIAKANQTITFGALANKTFGDADFNVSPTASSGLAVSLGASGNCTVTTPAPGTVHITGAGSCTITASQAGNANYNAATNVPQSFTIAKAGTSTAVSSSLNPSDFSQSVTFTAVVTSGSGTPTGTVQFKDNGTNMGAAVALNGSGQAQVSTSTLTAGTHTITADYSGDGNFLVSTGTLAGGQVVRPIPTLSIDDVSINEGQAGTTVMNFTVTLSAASNLTVTTNFASANNTATAGSDYVATNGTLTFNPGDLTKTIPVTINGDINFEPGEAFNMNLSNPVNANFSKAIGVGVILNDDAQGGFLGFSNAGYSVNENAGFVTVTVTRTNDVSQAAKVDYATDDTGSSTDCSALSTGLASQRCDYTSLFGTLSFAANETQKTIDIPINLDAYTEGPETFTVKLLNPTNGAVLVAPFTAVVTINDSASPTPNAIDDTTTFVRQQYRDFLNRDADPAGLAFWKNNIDKCNDPAQRPPAQTLAQCIEVQRITTSAAFFLSIEFRQTGGTVRDFYVASLNRPLTNNMPDFVEFMRDTQAIQKGVVVGVGNWQQVLDANRLAFMNEFVTRGEFVGLYPTTDTPTVYVDKLYQHAAVPPANPGERDAAISEFGNAATAADTGARARALLKITQNPTFQQRELLRGFVQMQYFGYLRRNPNAPPDNSFSGYDFWLNKLIQFNGDYLQAEMVKAFLGSLEYRKRFGP